MQAHAAVRYRLLQPENCVWWEHGPAAVHPAGTVPNCSTLPRGPAIATVLGHSQGPAAAATQLLLLLLLPLRTSSTLTRCVSCLLSCAASLSAFSAAMARAR
jgi:hypothetical protein